MAKLFTLLNSNVKTPALTLPTGVDVRNLQEKEESKYQNYSALMFIMPAHYPVIWKYVSQKTIYIRSI